MKPPPFDYLAPASLDEALAILERHGDQAKVLAGGQSLVPLLNFRLARPTYLVDLNEVGGLDGIRVDDGALVIGAMTRQRAVETSALVHAHCPLLAEAMPQIGHVQIRNRGTFGGSVAHADPASELPAVVAALEGDLVVQGAKGRRVLKPDAFFLSYFTTALDPMELLLSVRLPALPPRTGTAFLEVSRRHGDFALVGVAATLTVDEAGVCTRSAVALAGVGPAPVVAREAAGALVGAKPTTDALAEAARRVSATVRPESDLHASSDYRDASGGCADRAGARPLCRASVGSRGRRRGRGASAAMNERSIDVTVNGRRFERTVEVRKTLGRLPSRRSRADGDPPRLRARRVRRVHDRHGWCGGSLVPAFRRSGGWPRDPDGRGPRRWRHAVSAAGGLPRAPRAPVRVLHARFPHDARPASSVNAPTRPRRRSARRSPATSAGALAIRTSSRRRELPRDALGGKTP